MDVFVIGTKAILLDIQMAAAVVHVEENVMQVMLKITRQIIPWHIIKCTNGNKSLVVNRGELLQRQIKIC